MSEQPYLERALLTQIPGEMLEKVHPTSFQAGPFSRNKVTTMQRNTYHSNFGDITFYISVNVNSVVTSKRCLILKFLTGQSIELLS